jgi:hypothetical protein
MPVNSSTVCHALLGFGVTVHLSATAYAQIDEPIRGVPSEANHFIEKPQSWEHPTTSRGETVRRVAYR